MKKKKILILSLIIIIFIMIFLIIIKPFYDSKIFKLIDRNINIRYLRSIDNLDQRKEKINECIEKGIIMQKDIDKII